MVLEAKTPTVALLEEEQQAQVDAEALAARPEAVPDRGRGDDGREPDQPERVVVEADLVGDVDGP